MSDTSNNEVNTSNVEQTPVAATTPVVNEPAPVAPVAVPAQAVSNALNAEVNKPVETPAEPAKESESTQKPVEESAEGTKALFGAKQKENNSVQADLIVPEDPNSTSSKKESSQSSSDGEEFELEKENKKLPVAVLIIFAGLLLVVIIYYFIVMTPTKVFDKAIDNIFDTVTGVADSAKNSSTDTAKLKIDVDMETDGNINKFLDGILFDGAFDIDLKNLDLGLQITTHKGKSQLADEDQFNSRVYIKDGGIYVSNEKLEKTYPGKTVLYSDSGTANFGYDRVDKAIDVIRRTKNEIVDIIQNEQLKRTITIKKINGQTTIALKANCTLNNKEIADIYKPIFKEYTEDEEFIDQIVEVIGSVSKEEVKNKLVELYERDVVTQKIDVNLYMNLANTQLISLDVTVDDYFVEIDNLNGYFYGFVRYIGEKGTIEKPEFQIQFEYDANKGLLNGTGSIDIPGQTYFYSKFDYTRVEENEKKVGNKLNINFFNKKVTTKAEEDDKKNIFAKLKCTLNIDNNNPKVNILGEKDSVPMTDDIADGINESMIRLTHYVNYVFRTLLYSSWSDDKYAFEMYDRAVENKIQKAVDNDEPIIDINDIKNEVEEVKRICERKDTYAYLHNGASKTTGQFDSFPKLDNQIFDWACVFEEYSKEDEEYYNFDPADSLDFDHLQKVIDNKLKELNVKPTNKNIDIDSLTVTPDTKEIKVGESVKVHVAYEPKNATKTKITWSTSDKKVATVDENGNVTGSAKGTATITAKSESGKTITSKITVVEDKSKKVETNETSEESSNETEEQE